MFTDIVVLWILTQLHAPSWCSVLVTVSLICKIISAVVSAYIEGRKSAR